MCRHNERLADTVGFQILGDELGGDVHSAISEALSAGAQFCGPMYFELPFFFYHLLTSVDEAPLNTEAPHRAIGIWR